MRIVTLAALVALAVPLVQPSPAAAAPACKSRRLVCLTVSVPLDRTGSVPGTVELHVELLPNTSGPRRGVIFLVAGGPGQGSARTFDLGNTFNAAFFRSVFPGYELVAYDDRGTGASSALDCPALDGSDKTVAGADQTETIVAACADSLGPARDFYGTADHVEDLEAVRQALGADRIALFGVSYGTKLALAYAAMHPDHVARLLLDSVVPLDRPDPFETDELQALPATLGRYCPAESCTATPDFAGDVVALANELADAPLAARVRTAAGGGTPVQLGAVDFLGLVFAADLSPGLAAELPAAVHAALHDDPHPLLRLFALAEGGSAAVGDLSTALYLATTCHDGPFPWDATTAVADRTQSVETALAAAPGDWFGPFGPWASALGDAETCLGWPSPAGGTPLAPGPLPDVPVLALSGGLDLRTPTAWAASVVAQFPRGHLLVVPEVGHSVLTMDASGCSQHVVRVWLAGGTPPLTCPQAKPLVRPVAAYPTQLPAHVNARQTRLLVGQTLHEAEAIWLLIAGGGAATVTAPGLYGGRLTAHDRYFVLRRYAIAPGLALSGAIMVSKSGPPIAFSGIVFVDGAKTRGRPYTLENNRLR